MAESEEVVPLTEAMHEVEVAMTRLALMHLAYSKTLVEELGEERGKELIIKSIMEYGRRVGERVKRGHPDLPKYGVHERYVYGGREYRDPRKIPRSEDGRIDLSLYSVRGCSLAKVFREYGEEELGWLYCYVDAAKSMAADPDHKLIHRTCEACGDEGCTFELQPTTEKERRDFKNKDRDWRYVDPRLVEGEKTEKGG